MNSSPQYTCDCKTFFFKKSSCSAIFAIRLCLIFSLSVFGLAGCDKAKELADNAVNKVKEDFEKAKDEVRGASQPDVKNKKKDEIAFNRPTNDTNQGNPSQGNSGGSSPKSMSYEAFVKMGSINVEDQHLIALAQDPANAAKVIELNLSGAKISASGLEVLAKFTNLEKLDLTRTAACVGNMQSIGQVKSLKSLEVDFIPLADSDFKNISGLANLEEINLTATRITDNGFRCFENMPKLRLMMLDRMGHLEGKGFKWVNKNSIQEIRANGSSIGYFAFQNLSGSPSLEILRLNGARVTDKAMQGIGRCPNLKELWLEKNDLTNKGVIHLKNHQALEKVVLAGNRKLNNQALGYLTKTKTLVMVNVHDTLCSQEVEAEFLKHVPGCKLVF